MLAVALVDVGIVGFSVVLLVAWALSAFLEVPEVTAARPRLLPCAPPLDMLVPAPAAAACP
jgi:hypothetical protein